MESIGKRIAHLRQEDGWTQQSLADRLAMSRVAISHIEMDLTIPSERTITLMAGVFKLSPIQLVDGTSYPKAKTERLPDLTTTITDLELNLALLLNDLDWLGRLTDPGLWFSNAKRVLEKWYQFIENRSPQSIDEHETVIMYKIQRLVRELNDRLNHTLE